MSVESGKAHVLRLIGIPTLPSFISGKSCINQPEWNNCVVWHLDALRWLDKFSFNAPEQVRDSTDVIFQALDCGDFVELVTTDWTTELEPHFQNSLELKLFCAIGHIALRPTHDKIRTRWVWVAAANWQLLQQDPRTHLFREFINGNLEFCKDIVDLINFKELWVRPLKYAYRRDHGYITDNSLNDWVAGGA